MLQQYLNKINQFIIQKNQEYQKKKLFPLEKPNSNKYHLIFYQQNPMIIPLKIQNRLTIHKTIASTPNKY